MTIGQQIKAAIRYSNPRRTVREVAERLGVSEDRMSNIIVGRTKPSPQLVAAIRKELNLPRSWPHGDVEDQVGPAIEGPKPKIVAGVPMVPMRVAGTVAAGPGQAWTEGIDDIVYVPQALEGYGKTRAALIIEGDSLLPHLQPGDTAVFESSAHPKLGVVNLIEQNGEWRAKLLVHDPTKGVLVASYNPAYPAETLEGKVTRVLGFLVGYSRYTGGVLSIMASDSGLRF